MIRRQVPPAAPAAPPVLADGDSLLTVEEVGELLHASRSAVYGAHYEGRLPGFKPLKRLLFKRSDVLAMLTSTARGTVQPRRARPTPATTPTAPSTGDAADGEDAALAAFLRGGQESGK